MHFGLFLAWLVCVEPRTELSTWVVKGLRGDGNVRTRDGFSSVFMTPTELVIFAANLGRRFNARAHGNPPNTILHHPSGVHVSLPQVQTCPRPSRWVRADSGNMDSGNIKWHNLRQRKKK